MRSYKSFLAQVIRSAPKPLVEWVDVEDGSGRLLAESLTARLSDPAEHRSAMDGYAVRAVDLSGATARSPVHLSATGLSAAGATGLHKLRRGCARRIMTGAPLPGGADTVVPVERITCTDRGVWFDESPPRGAYVRRPAENFRRGSLLIRKGSLLRPQEVGLCITAGVTEVAVYKKPRVGVISTGDELVPAATKLKRGEVFDSNRPTILAMIADTGATPVNLGAVRDQTSVLRRRIEKTADRLDLLITIGGVSAGDFDIVKQLIVEYPDMSLIRVAMRPARPQAFGRVGKLLWYGLPGNPVSAMVAFDRFVRPLLLRAMGHRNIFRPLRSGICSMPVRKKHAFREFVRAHARSEGSGWTIDIVGPPGSSNLRSMVNANAFVVLTEGPGSVRKGARVAFELFDDPETRRSEPGQ